MADIGVGLLLVAGVLSALFVGPSLAIAFLLLRKARRRASRRSPLGINLLRAPGHTLREQLDDTSNDLTWDILVVSTIPLVLLALYLAQAHHRGLPQLLHMVPVYVVAALGVVVVMVRRMIQKGEQLDRLRTGYDAEVAVGQELDRLMRHGAYVFHDVPGENFNIDHVVVSSAGVFAVETKGYTKLTELKGREAATVRYDGQRLAFPTWTTSEPLEQAQRQAEWLSKWASSAVADRVEVCPVLALPGWFVQREQDGTVHVFSGRELGSLLLKGIGRPLPPAMVDRIAHQLDQRCRDVVPTYKRDPK